MTRAPRSSAFELLADFGGRGVDLSLDREAVVKASYDDGYRKGVADGKEESVAECEQRLADASQAFEARLKDECARWEKECGAALAVKLEIAAESLGRTIGDRVSALLRPWLMARLHDHAMFEFEKAVERAIKEGAKVHIEGPADALSGFRERFPVELLQIAFTETAEPQVLTQVDATQIEINFEAWLADLKARINE